MLDNWEDFLVGLETEIPTCNYIETNMLNQHNGDKIIGINVRGLKANFSSLEEFMNKEEMDMLRVNIDSVKSQFEKTSILAKNEMKDYKENIGIYSNSESMTTLSRYRGSLLGLAVGDALGTTLEFKEPGTFSPITGMMGGGPFNLEAGEWTDDTSMALCLADSLIEKEKFDPTDQMQRYLKFFYEGYLIAYMP